MIYQQRNVNGEKIMKEKKRMNEKQKEEVNKYNKKNDRKSDKNTKGVQLYLSHLQPPRVLLFNSAG